MKRKPINHGGSLNFMQAFTRIGCQVAVAVGLVMSAHLAAGAAPANISIPGERLVTESITSTAGGVLYIGSLGAKAIFRAKTTDAAAEAWVKPPMEATQGIYGVFADERSNTLYACVSGFGGAGKAELLTLELKTGKLTARYPFANTSGLCNDIATAADGTAYITDSRNMEVLRLKPQAKALEKWLGDEAFGPKGGVLDGISVLGNRVLVNTLRTNKLFSVSIESDGRAGSAVEVTLDRAIAAPDGMRSLGANSLLLAESGGAGVVSRIDLSGNTGKVTTLHEGFPGGPVSATAVGSNVYVVEAQFAALEKNSFKPFQVTVFPLPKK